MNRLFNCFFSLGTHTRTQTMRSQREPPFLRSRCIISRSLVLDHLFLALDSRPFFLSLFMRKIRTLKTDRFRRVHPKYRGAADALPRGRCPIPALAGESSGRKSCRIDRRSLVQFVFVYLSRWNQKFLRGLFLGRMSRSNISRRIII